MAFSQRVNKPLLSVTAYGFSFSVYVSHGVPKIVLYVYISIYAKTFGVGGGLSYGACVVGINCWTEGRKICRFLARLSIKRIILNWASVSATRACNMSASCVRNVNLSPLCPWDTISLLHFLMCVHVLILSLLHVFAKSARDMLCVHRTWFTQSWDMSLRLVRLRCQRQIWLNQENF